MPRARSSTTEEVLRLADEILRARAHLEALEGRFERLVGGRNGQRARSVAAASAASVPGDEVSRTAKIRAYLVAHPNKAVSVSDLHKAMPDVDAKLIRASLARWARTDKRSVRRRGRGKYVYRPAKATS